MAQRSDIVNFCSELLEAGRFRDAAVNGLQVEGREQVTRLASAVSVSERTLRDAVDWGAGALLVHHGLLWGERLGPIMGPLRNRLKLLFANDLNLIAYHLPLDAHPQLGNNAQLARALGMSIVAPFADVHGRDIGIVADLPDALSAADLAVRLEQLTGREALVIPGGPATHRRIGILSGSGSSALDEAIAAGCDALITGEAREPTMALARELGITVAAAGHEATERLGVQALAAAAAERFGLETHFFSDPNPV